MTQRAITVQFDPWNSDTRHTRVTEAAYTHASRQPNGDVHFHTSAEAARRQAGRYGDVVCTDFAPDVPSADDVQTWAVFDNDGNEVARYDIDADTFRRIGPVAAIKRATADGHSAARASRVTG